MKRILTTSIVAHLPVHISRSHEQPEPELLHSMQEQQQQEGPDPTLNPSGSGDVVNPPGQQQQQQQQQQEPVFVDPFKDVDLEMLPDATKESIKQARADLQRLQKADVTARQFQSTHDKQQAEINRLRDEMAKAQQPSQQQQQQQNQKEPTTIEMLEQQYIQSQIAPEVAKKMAAVNGPIFDAMQQRTVAQVQQQMGPLANMVITDQAASAFETIKQQDKLGWSQIPEVAQKTWDAIQAMAQQGQQVTPQFAANLSRIYFTEHVEVNGYPQSQAVQQQQQQQQPQFRQPPNMSNTVQPQHQATRFSYPGSGVSPTRPQVTNQGPIMDAETQAAMAATVTNWPVKPKAFRN